MRGTTTTKAKLHTCIVQLEFFGNARANARVLPQAGALDTGAGGTRAVTGALEAELVKKAYARLEGIQLTGFFSMRQRIHAPRLRTSCTSRRRAAEKRPRTFGLVGLVELPNSFTKPLA